MCAGPGAQSGRRPKPRAIALPKPPMWAHPRRTGFMSAARPYQSSSRLSLSAAIPPRSASVRLPPCRFFPFSPCWPPSRHSRPHGIARIGPEACLL